MRFTLPLAAVLLLAASPALAQKRCVKGIPCGGTCISATKTCRVGTGSATRAPAPKPDTAAPASDTTRRRAVGRGADASAGPIDLRADTTTSFVAAKGGAVYYLATCVAASEIPEAQRVVYATAAEAERAGLRRSKVDGC